MAEVSLRRVSKAFGAAHVIHDVSLDIRSGEFVVFVGPSGSGKSTLLRLVAGLEDVSEGSVSIAGRDVTAVPARDRGVAMVFQNYALYPHMTARDNMAFGLRNVGTPRAEADARVAEAARILGIEALLDRRPAAMSGGQRQRVAIGRAIVREPQVFLFDEPLSNLDAGLRVQMRAEIARLHHRLGATMVFVTHDQTEAMTMATRLVVLRAGRIEQAGRPLDLYESPRNLFVAGFLGSPRMNLLPGRVLAADAAGGALEVAGARLPAPVPGLAPGAAVTLGLRPESLVLDPAGPLRGRVEVAEELGALRLVHLRLADGAIVIAEVRGRPAPAIGAEAALAPAPGARLHVFDAEGDALGAPLERAA